MALMRGRVLVVAALACFWVMLGPAVPARAEIPKIKPVAFLESLADHARRLLNSHLTPAFTGEIQIGWWEDPPSDANIRTDPFSSDPTHGCQIAVDQPFFDANIEGQGGNGPLEAIVHEVFHCYEFALEGDYDTDVSHAANMQWLQEGLARWVDMQLFSTDPLPLSLIDLRHYFQSSGTSLFTRLYDAVGFWGHLEDYGGDLWKQIPHILSVARDGPQATLTTALHGLDMEGFFDTWGSSAANIYGGPPAWTAVSPESRGQAGRLAARLTTINPPSQTSSVPVKLKQYSTAQLDLTVPTPPSGYEETVRIGLDEAYGRFGVEENYTADELRTVTFLGNPRFPKLPPPPSCGPGYVLVKPLLEPIPQPAILGVAAGLKPTTVSIQYEPVPMQALGGICQPGAGGGGVGGGSASDGGDPHVLSFGLREFLFQAAGEYTLLRSRKGDDLDIQIRQQPFTTYASLNTAVAMRDGRATVEVDPTARGGYVVLLVDVNHRRTNATSLRLAGGGMLHLVHYAVPLAKGQTAASYCQAQGASGADLARCEKLLDTLARGAASVDVTWRDGSHVDVLGTLEAGGFHTTPSITVSIRLSRDRYRRVWGLLGDAGVPAARQFAGSNGTYYKFAALEDGGSALYDGYGPSWRITQKQSLFTYPRGKNTNSYAVANFPQGVLDTGAAPATTQHDATVDCEQAGITNPVALADCVYDVIATGSPAAAFGDEPIETIASGATSSPGSSAPVALGSIALGLGSASPGVAYDPASRDTYVTWVDPSLSSIDVCTVTAAAQSCNGGAGPISSSTRSHRAAARRRSSSRPSRSCRPAGWFRCSRRSTASPLAQNRAAIRGSVSSAGVRPPAAARSRPAARGSMMVGRCSPRR